MADAPQQIGSTRFHGDAVLRAAFISGVLGWGLGFYGPPIFLFAVVSRTGWPLALVSSAITLHFLWGALVVSQLPRLHARFGVARVTAAGAGIVGAGVIGWAFASELWQLYLAALFSGAGWVALSAAGLNAMISPWFVKRRPMALSKAYNGASVGGMVFSPLWSILISHIGFRAAAIVLGICTFLVMVWLARRVLKFSPSDLGQQPDGPLAAQAAPPQNEAQARAAALQAAWTPLKGAALWHNRRFWTLAAAMSLSLFAQIGLISQLYSWLAPQLGAVTSGWAMTVVTTCAVGGRMLFVKAMPHVQSRRLLTCASYGVQLLGSVMLLLASGPGVLLWCGLMLFGAGLGNTISLPPLIAQADFAASDVPRVVALIVAISQALYAFAPLAFSLLLKMPPGYPWLFTGAMALQALAALTLWSGRARAA